MQCGNILQMFHLELLYRKISKIKYNIQRLD